MLSGVADQIEEVLDAQGIDYEREDDYRGRGMSRETSAFTVEDPMIVAWACGRAEICIIEDVNLRTDNMGRRYVVY